MPEQAEAREGLRRRATCSAPRSSLDAAEGTAVASEDHLGVEDGDEPVEVAVMRRRDEGVDDASLNRHVGFGSGVPRLNAAAGAARKLASRIGGALDDRRDLLEGHAEDIVQHERDAFGRRKRLEHHEQCKADRVGQQRFVLRARSFGAVDDRLGHVRLAPRLA